MHRICLRQRNDTSTPRQEAQRAEAELVEMRGRLLAAVSRAQRLEYQIAQLEGSEFKGHSDAQADRYSSEQYASASYRDTSGMEPAAFARNLSRLNCCLLICG